MPELAEDIDIIAKVGDSENTDAVVADAVRELLRRRPELRISLAVKKYRSGAVSLTQAAELAEMSTKLFKDELSDRGISWDGGFLADTERRQQLEELTNWHSRSLQSLWKRILVVSSCLTVLVPHYSDLRHTWWGNAFSWTQSNRIMSKTKQPNSSVNEAVTVTKYGQATIPKLFRETLWTEALGKVLIRWTKDGEVIVEQVAP